MISFLGADDAGGTLATGLLSTIISSLDSKLEASATLVCGFTGGAVATGCEGCEGLGRVSGLTAFLPGISMGISIATGRGWVSNRTGNPNTPANTNTDAPISLCLARLRTASTLSAGALDADEADEGAEGEPARRKLKSGMVLTRVGWRLALGLS